MSDKVSKNNKLISELNKRILVIDGAMGTLLQKAGMPSGVSPDNWAVNNSDILKNIHNKYITAGADIIITCTFGSNIFKLKEYDLESKLNFINENAVNIAKSAVGNGNVFIAGGVGPLGIFIEPFGELRFLDAVNAYKQQMKVLIDNSVDMILVETLADIQEARAALIAAKELNNNIPVSISLTYDETKRTLTGTDCLTALFTLQELGADIISTNCSTGPKEMLEVIKINSKYSTKYLMAEPNAGMPKIINGTTIFDLSSNEFASYIPDFINSGINIIGGCCGTTPEYIKKIKDAVIGYKGFKPKPENGTVLTSQYNYHLIKSGQPVTVIGEKINPTGKKTLLQELKNNKFTELKKLAIEQIDNNADILDVNVGVPGINEEITIKTAITELSSISKIPLCIDSSNIKAIEEALIIYPGIALLNSISYSDHTEKLLKLVKKYGCSFIFLPMSDKSLPKTAEKRYEYIDKMLLLLKKYNINKSKMIVDGLVLSVSSIPNAAIETINTIKYAVSKGLNTVVGLSNISHGLPAREVLNAAFLNLAINNGLTAAILNPSLETIHQTIKSLNLIYGYDKDAVKYINYSANNKTSDILKPANEKIYNSLVQKHILTGDKEEIKNSINESLKSGKKPLEIVNTDIIPALNEVGELFKNKIYFLPQLLRSAETAQLSFGILKPYLENNALQKQEVIIMATVKGDIHDIGKNIVTLMLKNAGYKVIDLGKDIDKEVIISTAKKHSASVIGLSALMTTTMQEMKAVIEYKNIANCKSRIIIGGASTTKDYADEIGADGWAQNAFDAVELVKKFKI